MAASQIEIRQAYRSLYKSFLKAVRYSKPARYIVHERIRDAFHSSPATDFDQSRIQRTLEFADGAARSSGLEHTIMKNLVHVYWGRKDLESRFSGSRYVLVSCFRENLLFGGQANLYRRNVGVNAARTQATNQAYAEFDRNVQMLNETMGLCIK